MNASDLCFHYTSFAELTETFKTYYCSLRDNRNPDEMRAHRDFALAEKRLNVITAFVLLKYFLRSVYAFFIG